MDIACLGGWAVFFVVVNILYSVWWFKYSGQDKIMVPLGVAIETNNETGIALNLYDVAY